MSGLADPRCCAQWYARQECSRRAHIAGQHVDSFTQCLAWLTCDVVHSGMPGKSVPGERGALLSFFTLSVINLVFIILKAVFFFTLATYHFQPLRLI